MSARIKRGVSLYSYQHEYAHGTFTLNLTDRKSVV